MFCRHDDKRRCRQMFVSLLIFLLPYDADADIVADCRAAAATREGAATLDDVFRYATPR